ncbi:shikimate dehydrogenase [Zavarzinella formosa]|uniref:shikimate dehydrogenase n=1 Tax=Zavarzinella formosa TaxID=360055 RepID=UPI00036BB64D|nr:shikimate dehydrogenase [Zavarzinella formosa]
MPLSPPDRVCVIVGRTRHKMMQIELEEAVTRGAKFIEVRLDFLSRAVDFQRLMPHKRCEWVATLRRHTDGGRWKGTEDERRTVLRQAIVGGFDWVDIETDVAGDIRRFGKVKRIVSYHNFEGTPDNIEEIYAKMCEQDSDVVKIVTMAQHPKDCMKILKLIKNSKKPTIGHCMGEIGLPSRILSLKMGAPFLYAAFNKERGIAPGLPSLDEVKRFFQVDRINSDTKVYGVMGDPVSHSFSPALHNAMFHRVGENAVYLPFRVPRGEFQETVQAFEQLPVTGYSVTIPHKESAAAIAVEKDARVQETSAANTLVRRANGFHAANTDYDAALNAMKDTLPKTEDGVSKPLNTCSAMILGAGGAARAVVHALHRAGVAPIYVVGRTMEKAEKLAAEVSGKAVEWERRHNLTCDYVVNCTPLGMHPNLDESPLIPGFLKPDMVVFDTIYNPEQTMLLKEAKLRGCQIVSGVDMFVRQAAIQFELFTGRKPALEEMREIFRRAMSPVNYDRDKDSEEEEQG